MSTFPGHCRLCRAQLHSILNLGELALPWFPKVTSHDPIPHLPLHLGVCDACALVQLYDTTDPALLYKQYWYRSGINEAMRAELTDLVAKALLEVSVYEQDLVMDVGANDGFLLSQYPKCRSHWNTPRVAFEPAENLRERCAAECEVLVPDYFPPKEMAGGVNGRVKILTSVAMFYDLDDPTSFVRAVDRVLHEEGLWVVQMQDLGQMIEACAIDNICHEHLTYWSLAAFCWFLAQSGCDLHVTHVERRPINGGSLRIYVRRKLFAFDQTIETLMEAERAHIGWQALDHFAWQAEQMRQQLSGMLHHFKLSGKTIDLYGASTKANTLLQWIGATGDDIRNAWERNVEKYGRMTSTGIPIVSEDYGRQVPPDLLLVGIWQFRDQVLAREQDYLAAGGTIVFPLPEVDLVQG